MSVAGARVRRLISKLLSNGGRSDAAGVITHLRSPILLGFPDGILGESFETER
jgi:hypothetical protein